MTAEPLWHVGGPATSTAADGGASPSFDALYREHYARLHRFVMGMTRHDPVAEDIAQETLLRAFLHWDDLDPSRPAWPWLKKVATRLVFDHSRAQRSAVPDAGEAQIIPDTAAVYADRQLVGQMLDALPERQRTAITLRYLDDWKSAEIAAVLGLPRPAVEQLLLRARRSLKIEYRRLSGDRLRLLLWPLLGWSFRLRQRFARGVELVGDRSLSSLAATAESVSALVVAGALTVGAGLAGGEGRVATTVAGYADMRRVDAVAAATAGDGVLLSGDMGSAHRTRAPAATRSRLTASTIPSGGTGSSPTAERHVDVRTSGPEVTERHLRPRAEATIVRNKKDDRLRISSDMVIETDEHAPTIGRPTVWVPCRNGMVMRATCDSYDTAAEASPGSP